MKYLVVTGGVVSGLGKGISISSIGVLLKSAGLRVTAIKIDPYLNSDAGTMSPFEHGEVFVLNDGGEADLDLGNYERFLDVTLTRDHNITTGKVYSQVINSERRGDYLGKTVQVIPHVTDAVQNWLQSVSHMVVDAHATGMEAEDSPPCDVCLVEVGGTVGDIESLVFLEALRQFQFRVGVENICFVHVSLVPVLGSVGEQKTKPTQHTVKELRSVGLNPDIILCRSASPLEAGTREKLAHFCQVPAANVMTVHDVSNIYHVPLLLASQGAAEIVARRLNLVLPHAPVLGPWRELAAAVDGASDEVHIALVGKYTGLQDSYLSVIKSLQHAAVAVGRRLVVDWIDATALEAGSATTDPEAHAGSWETVRAAHGILVPGGFGDRGVEGKIAAVRYARESKKPFLGICLGMQCAVIEYARSVLGWTTANSAEFDSKSSHPVVIFMPEINPSQMGGTMRLGARATLLQPGATLARDLYGRETKAVWERHRHRYEVNPELVPALTAAGMVFAGVDDRGQRMEIIELDRSVHPFFFACQYHPEFQSHPHKPSPPFHGLLLAASGQIAGKLPLPATVRRKPSVALSAPTSPARPAAGAAGATSGAAAVAAAGGRPPLAPSAAGAPASGAGSSASAGAGAGAWTGGVAAAGGGGGGPSLPGSAHASPARPVTVRQAELSSMPPASATTLAGIAPSDGVAKVGGGSAAAAAAAAGGVTVPEGTFRANPC